MRKLLDDEINSKALEALGILSGARHLNDGIETERRMVHSAKGAFWPMVRERMKTNAVKLYRMDHPETQDEPKIKELKKAGYMKAAKTMALREIQAEKKAGTLTK